MAFSVQDVSVIIINYNGQEVLPRAIESVLSLHPAPAELIVLDNGSTDDSLAVIQRYSKNPLLRPIISYANLGVAGGRNLAASQALHPILAFLDADGEALDSWLPEALSVLNRYPDTAAVAPLVLLANGQTINGAGGIIDRYGHGCDRLWGEPLASHLDTIQQWAEQPVDYPMGCGMVIRTTGAESIWPLDDTLLKWHDDTELGLRLARQGQKTRFAPTSRVLHRPGHSDPEHHLERHAAAENARFYFLWKYYSPRTVLVSLAYYLFHALTGSRRDRTRLKDAANLVRFLWQNRHTARAIRHRWTTPRN